MPNDDPMPKKNFFFLCEKTTKKKVSSFMVGKKGKDEFRPISHVCVADFMQKGRKERTTMIRVSV